MASSQKIEKLSWVHLFLFVNYSAFKLMQMNANFVFDNLTNVKSFIQNAAEEQSFCLGAAFVLPWLTAPAETGRLVLRLCKMWFNIFS
jgi:hypothetical protein